MTSLETYQLANATTSLEAYAEAQNVPIKVVPPPYKMSEQAVAQQALTQHVDPEQALAQQALLENWGHLLAWRADHDNQKKKGPKSKDTQEEIIEKDESGFW